MHRKINIDTTARDVIPIAECVASKPINFNDELFQLTLDAVVKNHPGKILFSYLEAGSVLNVKDEFIRRRVLSGSIKAVYIGDKPMIHITEITRLTLEGVN